MKKHVFGWLATAALAFSPLAVAGTACPQFFLNGQQPTVSASESSRTTQVCYQDYVLMASGVTKENLYSAEHLTAAEVAANATFSRTGSWHQDAYIPDADRASSSDYTNSGYDRGHMTPAGDPGSPDAERETFSMANVVPQYPGLNRGEWEKIEKQTRSLATANGYVDVVTGPLFTRTPVRTIGSDQVAIPDYTWKAIYVPGEGAAAYLCTNDSAEMCQVVSVQEIADLSGVDPFPSLSSSQKANPIALTVP
ncbi:DNA/RNA non-specific endonuclease [Oleiagrimonas sp. C23AA]|uniref:DNA/RNA non-specific endonuclease n=1 Tax=Oleiagrimonas sp. C23AA TaxID=2719047 RepID=UPI00141DFBF4|nr:DNA/RNA non-specific endonuclease [Oleiagrimonas sp. C23AA]NII09108.1 DNA/RNA non-specific endonuclease [Oleiagrimonas sp. C23AA]